MEASKASVKVFNEDIFFAFLLKLNMSQKFWQFNTALVDDGKNKTEVMCVYKTFFFE